jgi:hypothetical protein
MARKPTEKHAAEQKLAALNKEIREQETKYDAARGTVPYVALLQIDRKLTRLMHERDGLEIEP